MDHVYIAVTVADKSGAKLLLLCQKNIYMVPHGAYEFAAIAANAAQYVLPGGQVQADETPPAAAVREFAEDTGVTLQESELKLQSSVDGEYSIYHYDAPNVPLDCNAVNAALKSGKAVSLKANNFAWFPLESALCALGNKSGNQPPPWASAQVMRAVEAGFSDKWINRRVNDPHTVFTKAVAQLILEYS